MTTPWVAQELVNAQKMYDRITDPLNKKNGIVLAADPTQYPPAPYVGQYVDDASDGKLRRWNGAAWKLANQAGFVVATTFLSSPFSVGTGGAAGGSLFIPALVADAMLSIKLEVTPPASSQATTLLSYSGDSRLSAGIGPFRTPVTSATVNKHDFTYQVPVAAGGAGTTNFTVTPNFNGCTARINCSVYGTL